MPEQGINHMTRARILAKKHKLIWCTVAVALPTGQTLYQDININPDIVFKGNEGMLNETVVSLFSNASERLAPELINLKNHTDSCEECGTTLMYYRPTPNHVDTYGCPTCASKEDHIGSQRII